MSTLLKFGFGGGCHWCTEAVFKQLKGVYKVLQGYIASTSPFSNFSELSWAVNPVRVEIWNGFLTRNKLVIKNELI